MKILPGTLLRRLILSAFISPLPLAGAFAAPAIFNITKTADPGDVIAIQGSGFGANPSVTVSDGTNSGVLTLANGGILNADGGNNISVLTPSTVTAGKILTVTVSNNGSSDASQVNLPEAWCCLDLAGTEISPGRTFRIMGNNLWADGVMTNVWLYDGSTFYPCTGITGSDRFIIQATAPSNLPLSRNFTVYVRAGGVTTGNGVAQPITLTSRANGADVWDLGVPWGADYAPFYTNKGSTYNVKTAYGAVGNGVADDSAKIQAAIDDANQANGGTVYLPAGTYNVGTSTLSVKPKVVLQGDGPGQTIIQVTSSSAKERPVSMDGDLTGLVDLKIRVHASVGGGVASTAGREATYANNRSKVFAVGCVFENYKPAEANNLQSLSIRWEGLNKAVVKGCSFYVEAKRHDFGNAIFQRSTDVMIRDNTFTYRDSRIWFNQSRRVQFEDNVANRCNDRIKLTGKVQNSGGPYFPECANMAFLNNTVQWMDATGTGEPVLVDVDGESFLAEGPTEAGWGDASAGGSNTLTGSFKIAPTTFRNLTSVPHFVMLTGGVGAGQMRRVTANTTNQITVSPAWDVLPVSGTRFAIFRRTVENVLLKGNTVDALRFGVYLSSADAFNVNIVGNNFLDTRSVFILSYQNQNDDLESGHTYSVTKDVVIEGNNCVNTGKFRLISPEDWYPSTVTLQVNGNRGDEFWNVVTYGNSIQALALGLNAPNDVGGQILKDGYVAVLSANPPGPGKMQGLLFDRNTAVNCDAAYYLAATNLNTTIWNTSLMNGTGRFKGWVDAPNFVAYGPYASSSNIALDKPCGVSSLSPTKVCLPGSPWMAIRPWDPGRAKRVALLSRRNGIWSIWVRTKISIG